AVRGREVTLIVLIQKISFSVSTGQFTKRMVNEIDSGRTSSSRPVPTTDAIHKITQ
ncbi:hypothetical protein CCACVL1_01463, partial [Corchorus capsularis]